MGVSKTEVLNKIDAEPVGGTPGNPMFWVYLQLGVRGSFFATVLACLVWFPPFAAAVGMTRYAGFMPLAICIFIFTINPIFGTVIDNASAGVWGTFVACFSIFMLRGFFAEGVEPGMGFFSAPSLVGWTTLIIFDAVCLMMNLRMATRMFAMASFTGFMLAFLNPADQTPYSKNFKININGTAVSSFIGVSIGAITAVVAMCVPYPWRFAFNDMAAGGHKASEDTARLFKAAVTYFKGSKATVMIDQQLAMMKVLQNQLGGLGGSIGAAWLEGFDIGTRGTIRNLMIKHAEYLGKIYDILNSLSIAISTEDFDPATHDPVMEKIGDASSALVDAANILLIVATDSAADGEVSGSEKAELNSLKDDVMAAQKELYIKFNEARQLPVFKGAKVCKELLSESFFVFSLAAYGRLVCEYADLLQDPPQGDSLVTVCVASLKAGFDWPGGHHDRFTLRYLAALLLCFIFGVVMDNYGGACAITAVFLLNTRHGPDMMATLNVLLAVVVGCVAIAIVFSYSCMGAYDHIILPTTAFLYWVVTIHVGYCGSPSFGLVGLLMAGLSPFTMVTMCPGANVDEGAAAVGLWVGIRGCIIAMVIVSLCEVASVPGWLSKLAIEDVCSALGGVQEAFDAFFHNSDPKEKLGPVAGFLGAASSFSSAARLEPRGTNCPWKQTLLDELVTACGKLRLDVMTLYHAMTGADGQSGGIVAVLSKHDKPFAAMKKDISETLKTTSDLSKSLLEHGQGPFSGMKQLEGLEGCDNLEPHWTNLIEEVAQDKDLTFPTSFKDGDTLEDDMICQLSIIFVMLDYSIKHVADMIKANLRFA